MPVTVARTSPPRRRTRGGEGEGGGSAARPARPLGRGAPGPLRLGDETRSARPLGGSGASLLRDLPGPRECRGSRRGRSFRSNGTEALFHDAPVRRFQAIGRPARREVRAAFESTTRGESALPGRAAMPTGRGTGALGLLSTPAASPCLAVLGPRGPTERKRSGRPSGGAPAGGIACQPNRECEGSVQACELRRRNGADVVRERCPEKAHELVAVNAALVLEAFFDADLDLAVKAVSTRVDRGADDRGERRVDEQLPADHDKGPLPSRIT